MHSVSRGNLIFFFFGTQCLYEHFPDTIDRIYGFANKNITSWNFDINKVTIHLFSGGEDEYQKPTVVTFVSS